MILLKGLFYFERESGNTLAKKYNKIIEVIKELITITIK